MMQLTRIDGCGMSGAEASWGAGGRGGQLAPACQLVSFSGLFWNHTQRLGLKHSHLLTTHQYDVFAHRCSRAAPQNR